MYTHTKQTAYALLRNTVEAASKDTDLTSTQKTWAHFCTTYSTDTYPGGTVAAKSWNVPEYANAAIVVFDHKNANTDTATFVLYGYREGGPAEFICSGNLTAGAQKGDVAPVTKSATARYFADTITSFVTRWPQLASTTDAAANDGVAKVSFDLLGISRLLCLFTAISSSDNVRAKVAAIG